MSDLSKRANDKNFKTVDLLPGFVLGNGGESARRFLKLGLRSKRVASKRKNQSDNENRRARVYRDSDINKHSPRWYNSFSKHLVGNYENWVYAPAVKDWCAGSYKTISDNLKTLDKMDLLKETKKGLPGEWRTAYCLVFAY